MEIFLDTEKIENNIIQNWMSERKNATHINPTQNNQFQRRNVSAN